MSRTRELDAALALRRRSNPHVYTPAWSILFVLSGACSGSRDDVTVSGRISEQAFSVSAASSLSARLTGRFSLTLELGQYADRGTDVPAPSFSLMRAAGLQEIQPLQLVHAPTYPIHLEAGSSQSVHSTVADGSEGQELAPAAKRTELCQSAPLVVRGTFRDTRSGQSTSVQSEPFELAGCP